MNRFIALLALAGIGFIAVPGSRQAIQRQPNGIDVPFADGLLRLDVCADDVIRVARAQDPSFFSRKSLMVDSQRRPAVKWNLVSNASTATLSTSAIKARIDLATGNVTFLDSRGLQILAEKEHMVTPAEVQGEKTFHVRQQWLSHADESLYGLGQQQQGIVNIKGFDLDLWQHNTNVVVPFLVSSRGWGVLWDNDSYSRFGDLRPFVAIPPEHFFDSAGNRGGLTSGIFTPANPDELRNPATESVLVRKPDQFGSIRWVGEILAPATGDYQFQTYSNGGIKVWIDKRLVINHWRQSWLTDYDQIKIHLVAGKRYPLKIESGGDQTSVMQFMWKPPAASGNTSLWSEVGDGIDYYFVYGPQPDKVIGGYRRITGRASMLPVWAFGLWQSRQRYETGQQLLDALDGFRSRKIPIDNIVQDWMYWPQSVWGSHQFDTSRFPDPEGWIKAIHDKNARLMISVWGKFYSGTDNFKAMQQAGYIYQATLDAGMRDWVGPGYSFTFYDAFNPGARKLFWDQINTALFSKGIDAWWMDATEPEVVQPSPSTLELMRRYIGRTAMGTASRVLNAYALVNSQGVYEGQRSVAPDQRVFILTRSGFAGLQRYATATWSGDITSTWTAMARQIAAGLGFCISGVPYWTMDVGGYTMESRFSNRNQTPENAEEWRELNARWFQFGTFCPLLRVHGEQQPREMWTLGGESHPAYKAELKFDRLRYALLPYIYSIAGDVTHNSSTMMRPLVMDFRNDRIARDIADQYMFGPAFLVAPVTTYKARSRRVYLPQSAGWYDFWTGMPAPPGETIDAPAPYDAMPLYIRAGSIIPFGPELQYTSERPADPIVLHIYAGADGSFTIYEDEGVNYGYEKGAFARIPIRWNDATRTLTIGKRTGSFRGMLAGRTFSFVLISKNKPAGFSFTPAPHGTIRYSGDAVTVRVKQ